MKFNHLLLVTAAIAMTLPASAAKSQKRGVSESNFQFVPQMEVLAPGVSWYYNWSNVPNKTFYDVELMEFVPMCWNAGYNADNIRAYVKAHPEVKYILGFNEPNFTAQANMTPQAAAEAWPAVQALAKELGLKLVAPALNYSPNPPYQSPTAWMDEFVKLVGNDAFDYLALHNYGGFGVMKDLCTTFHDRYGKDIWVTEFCLWPGEGTNTYVSPENQVASMVETVNWLERTEWIYRYAWFKAIGNSTASSGPNYGLIKSGKGNDPRELSEQGKVYVNLPAYDPDLYYSIGETISSADYSNVSNTMFGSSNYAKNPKAIEITKFNAGAWIDYQFDVPVAGEYTLTLKVSGQGEPTRFDPNLAIYSVKADGEEGSQLSAPGQFTLPGDDEKYVGVTFPLHLEAGKQAIRIKDMAPYQPSGIRIATVNLSDASGVVEIGANGSELVNVYTLQGLKVREQVEREAATEGLPAGLYIVGGEKVLVK